MNVSVGSAAPEFSLRSIDNRNVSLSDYRGRKVLVSFLRNAKCAICNLWVAKVITHAPKWRLQGLEVIAVFESSLDNLQVQFEHRHAPFAIVADTDGSIHELYGSLNDPKRVQEILSLGTAKEALQRAAEAGFAPVQEEGANFNRIPSEVLIDEFGRVVTIHVAHSVFNHMTPIQVDAFLESDNEKLAG